MTARSQAGTGRATAPRSLGPTPRLDGLRGLAILAVLGTHVVFLDSGSATWSLRGGFLGVDVFLGLSAFLISAVLLREIDQRRARTGGGAFDAAHFARRRFRRLYPAMSVLILVAGVVAIGVLHRDAAERIRSSIPALAFLANWQRTWGDPLPFELVHLWSLSLEAQFYALMALTFFLARRHLDHTRAIVALLLGAAVVVAAWRWHLFDSGVAMAELYERTDTRADSMFLGMAAALAWRGRLLGHRSTAVLGTVAAAGLLVAFALVEVSSEWLYRGGFTVISVAAALVVMAVATGAGTIARGCEWTPLRMVGEISYSLYLWHLPVFVWTVMLLGDGRPLALKAAVAVPASVAIAWISYVLFERSALAPWRRSAAGAAAPHHQRSPGSPLSGTGRGPRRARR
ncbi:MAG: acyltransferase [Microthrixaceae bacterium]|nr:acyltransferase [Microthrixaceae bacterium]